MRRLPAADASTIPTSTRENDAAISASLTSDVPPVTIPAPVVLAAPPRRAAVAPLTSDRYLLRVTIDARTQATLDRARDLLRHTIPSGDLAEVLDRAVTVLIEQLERRKVGRRSRPARTRARVTGMLDLHHVVPFARGGASDAANLELRCRAHNACEAAHDLGEVRPNDSRNTPDAP